MDRQGSPRRIVWQWPVLALFATLLTIGSVLGGWTVRADNVVYDRLLQLRAEGPSDEIVVVAIDEESLSRLGRWPWPRDVHGMLLDRLAAARPKAILYDILFLDSGSGDAALAAAVARTRPVLPLLMEVPGRAGQAITVEQPPAAIRAGASGLGHVNLSPDEDGIVRRVHLAEGPADSLWPHVSTLLSCRLRQTHCDPPRTAEGSGLVRRLPTLIPFAAGRQQYRTIPFALLLEGGVPPEFLRDKVILVGATAAGLGDNYATPMAETGVLLPGVELNANIVQALLDGSAIRPLPPLAFLLFSLVPPWLLMLSFLRLRPRLNLLLGFGMALGLMAVSAFALIFVGWWFPPITSMLALAVALPAWGWCRLAASSAYMREELARFSADPQLPTADGNEAGEKIGTEIDQMRRTIARARDLKQVLTDTLRALPDPSMIVGQDGIVQVVNDRAFQLLGRLAGQHFTAMLPAIGAGATDTSKMPGDGALPSEVIGAGRVYLVSWSPIRGSDGIIDSWVLRLADVTHLRLVMRQREEALQLLTHDMRTPQAALLASLDQAGSDIPAPLRERLGNYARRTLELADGFVQLARADAQPLELETLSLGDLMLNAADECWPLSSARRIDVDCRACEVEALISADRSLLSRALCNLLGNAIKYAPEGSIVTCRVTSTDEWAEVSVSDQGPGIAEDQRGTLFEPFRRFERKIGGAGLGLSFVRSVAERHGGTIAYRPAADGGQGACFTFTLRRVGC